MIKTVQNAFVLKQGIYGGYDQWSIFGKSNKNYFKDNKNSKIYI